MKNKFIKILMLPALLFTITSCGQTPTTSAPSNDNSTNSGDSNEQTSRLIASVKEHIANAQITDGLLSLDSKVDGHKVSYTIEGASAKIASGEEKTLIWFRGKQATANIKFTVNGANGETTKAVEARNSVEAKDAFNADEQSEVEITGIVYAKQKDSARGYYIYDFSGNAFIFGPASAVKPGQLVKIKGTKSTFYSLVQIKHEDESSIKVLGEGFDTLSASEIKIADIYDKDPAAFKSLGARYLVQAQVVRRIVGYETRYYLVDPITKMELSIYYLSDAEEFSKYEGQVIKVSLTAYTYNDENKNWEVTFTKGVDKVTPVEFNYSDEESVDGTFTSLVAQYKNKSIVSKIDLIKTDAYFKTQISYVSNDPTIISNDGVIINSPTEDMTVSFKVTASKGSVSKEKTVSFKVIAKKVLSLSEAYKKAYVLKDGEESKVTLTSVVSAAKSNGLFLGDETYGFYADFKSTELPIPEEGDKIEITGKLALINGCPSITQILDYNVISKGNAIVKAEAINIDDLPANIAEGSKMAKYVTIEGDFISVPGQYGNSYSITSASGKTISLHANSNGYALNYLHKTKVKLSCYLYEAQAGGSYKAFFYNRDNEISYVGDNETKISIAEAYLKDIMPKTGSLITASMFLPSTHMVDSSLKYEFTSSNVEVINNSGQFNPKDSEQNVTLTAKIKVGTQEKQLTYSYVACKKVSNYYTDLVFSGILRGINYDKLLSIYNNTGVDVDLSKYTIAAFQNSGNGSSTVSGSMANVSKVRKLEGTLKQGETLVIYNSSSSVYIKKQIDMNNPLFLSDNSTSGITQFNAKDADVISLVRDEIIIDQIGSTTKLRLQGMSANWEEEMIANKMLIRNKNVGPQGNYLDWTVLANGKKVFAVSAAPMPENEYTINPLFFNYKL